MPGIIRETIPEGIPGGIEEAIPEVVLGDRGSKEIQGEMPDIIPKWSLDRTSIEIYKEISEENPNGNVWEITEGILKEIV